MERCLSDCYRLNHQCMGSLISQTRNPSNCCRSRSPSSDPRLNSSRPGTQPSQLCMSNKECECHLNSVRQPDRHVKERRYRVRRDDAKLSNRETSSWKHNLNLSGPGRLRIAMKLFHQRLIPTLTRTRHYRPTYRWISIQWLK